MNPKIMFELSYPQKQFIGEVITDAHSDQLQLSKEVRMVDYVCGQNIDGQTPNVLCFLLQESTKIIRYLASKEIRLSQ